MRCAWSTASGKGEQAESHLEKQPGLVVLLLALL